MLHNLQYIDSKGLQEEFELVFFIFLLIFTANILFIFTNLYKYYFAFIVIQFLAFIIFYANFEIILFLFYAGIFSLYGLLTADGEWFAEGWPNLHVLGIYQINIVLTILLFLYKYWARNKRNKEAEK